MSEISVKELETRLLEANGKIEALTVALAAVVANLPNRETVASRVLKLTAQIKDGGWEQDGPGEAGFDEQLKLLMGLRPGP